MSKDVSLNESEIKAAYNLLLNQCEFIIGKEAVSIAMIGHREETHTLFNKLTKVLYPEITINEKKYLHYYSGEMADTWTTKITDNNIIDNLKNEVHKLSESGLSINTNEHLAALDLPENLRTTLENYINRFNKEKSAYEKR